LGQDYGSLGRGLSACDTGQRRQLSFFTRLKRKLKKTTRMRVVPR
jgi:hypothetical protein